MEQEERAPWLLQSVKAHMTEHSQAGEKIQVELRIGAPLSREEFKELRASFEEQGLKLQRSPYQYLGIDSTVLVLMASTLEVLLLNIAANLTATAVQQRGSSVAQRLHD